MPSQLRRSPLTPNPSPPKGERGTEPSPRGEGGENMEPFAIGVCSWSLQVKRIPELAGFMKMLGLDVAQIACGDPHHAARDEGDAMPAAAKAAGFRMSGSMLGFPGEDYTTPQTIERTGGVGDPATRAERLETLKWGVERTRQLGLADIMLHA